VCNATGVCQTGVTQSCANGCNTATQDCNLCATGQTSCSGVCRNLTNDASNCASCGARCPQPIAGSGAAICAASACDVTCSAGFLKCNAAANFCGASTWGFEDGVIPGFVLNTSGGTDASTVMTVSSVRAHTGTRSLAFALTARGQARGFFAVMPLCNGTGMIGNATQATIWYFVDGPATVDPMSYVVPDAFGTAGNALPPPQTFPGVGSWQTATVSVTTLGPLYQFSVAGYMYGSADWDGTVYIDDIVLQ
jgi:hypothetical protein